MAIVKMKRFTLLTFHEYKPQLLKDLQQFGDVHLKDLQKDELTELEFLSRDGAGTKVSEYESELLKVQFALDKLRPFAPKKSMTAPTPTLTFEEFDAYLQGYDYQAACDKVRQEDERYNRLGAEIAKKKTENETLSSWVDLDVAPGNLDALKTVRAYIGTVNKLASDELKRKVEEQFDCAYIERLGIIKDDQGILVIAPEQQADEVFELLKELGFSRLTFQITGVPTEIIAQNQKEIEALEAQREKSLENTAAMVGEYDSLQVVSDYLGTVLERERVRQNFLGTETVVLIQGWVPADDLPKLEGIVEKACTGNFFLESEDVAKDSADVPIKLRHNGFVAPFVDVTSMYSMPRYNEIDPTPIFAPFYFLFFGLMVGDIGYGLLLMIATGIILKVCNLKEGMQRFMKFFFILSIAVIGAGFLYGGAFGVTVFAPISYETVNEAGQVIMAKKPILDSELDIIFMLILSIVLGVIHIYYGLLVKCYMQIRDGDPLGAFLDSFIWIICVSAAILWLLAATGIFGGPQLAAAGKWVFIATIVILALTQGREYKSIGGKIGGGLYGVYGLTSYVGDFVSYTRIVALALAGAYIAISFNMMAGLVYGDSLSWTVIPAAIVAVAGQALNIGLALLGAYVHTCRLQYVEFFGKFYEGGGKAFAPFGLKNQFIKIKG